jgi:hypothetical protein
MFLALGILFGIGMDNPGAGLLFGIAFGIIFGDSNRKRPK